MVCTEFDSLKPLRPYGDELAEYGNASFSTNNDRLFGVQIRLWIEQAVVGFLEAHHNLPPVTNADLDAATKGGRRPGESQYRIDRVLRYANGSDAYLLRAMHRVRQYGNKSNHGTPEYVAGTKKHAKEIRDWLVKEYVPLYSASRTTAKRAAPAQNYPTEARPEESGYDPLTYGSSKTFKAAPAPQPAAPRKSDPSYINESFYKPEFAADPLAPRRSVSSKPFLSADMMAFLAVAAVVLSLGLTVLWYSYRAVVAVAEWWTGLPTLTQMVKNIPVPSNPWANDSKPTSPVTKAPPTFAERVQILPPEVTRPRPQPVSPPVTPSPPPIVQFECPPGTLYDAYTSQCTFLPSNDQAASAAPALSIHPECPPGSTYSDQSPTCATIEANNECPPGTYLREGSHQCLSKLKYPLLRYEATHTLLATSFVQAPPVEESYVVSVLAGSLRIFYLEDPASARNVVLSGRAQHLYNYAIISCVICPATFVTRRVN